MATSRTAKAKTAAPAAAPAASTDALEAKVSALEAKVASLEKALSAISEAHSKLSAECATKPVASGSVDLTSIENRLKSLARDLSRKQDKSKRI